ncbi:MAG: hypothetical protein LBD48_08010, partial [Treponema sp.]|nr:hypothetical protein [Treponema sp.]
PPASQNLAAYSALLKSLGLPADRLSTALVSFARFFSLPLESSLLTKIRRQALQAAAPENSGPPASAVREAAALAATAAEDKGAALSPAALESYAAALDPEAQPDDQIRNEKIPSGKEGVEDRDSETSGGNSGDMGKQGEGDRSEGHQNKDKRPRRPDSEINDVIAGGPLGIKAKMLAASVQNPLLNLLNQLPGKNGQRWIVLPFSFTEQGESYRVSLKILLHEVPAGNSGEARAEHMALDIVKGAANGKAEQRWLFSIDRANDKNPQLQVRLRSVRRKEALSSLGRNLAALLDIPPECVSVHHCAESFPLVEDSSENILRSINEEA